MKRIALNKDTLRKLNFEELNQAAGGAKPCCYKTLPCGPTTVLPCMDSVVPVSFVPPCVV